MWEEKAMKKFLLTILLFVCCVALLTMGINAVYIRQDHRDRYYTDRFQNIPDAVTVCNVGSSHGYYSFNYEELQERGEQCFNFAFSAQFPSYDLVMLQHFGEHLAPGCVVFIPLSDYLLFGGGLEEDADFLAINRRYYKIFFRKEIKQYDPWTDFLVNKMPVLDAGEDLLRGMEGKLVLDHSEWDRTADDIDLEGDLQYSFDRHFVHGKRDAMGNLIYNHKEIEAVYSMISLCNAKGWRPILVTTPLLKEYSERARQDGSDQLEAFYRLVEQITEETNTPYFDYSLDKRFANDHGLFMDGDHLNRNGARIFTGNLLKDVEETRE